MLSLVIPVYRNETSIPALVDAVQGLNDALDGNFEAVFVVDGSPDRCYELLNHALPSRRINSQLLLLSRNFGSFAAIRAGLEVGKGDRYAVMAADLQEPPELVLEMDRILRLDQEDVIVASRIARSDPIFTRWSSGLFWWLYRRFVIPEMPPGGIDVFACNRVFRDQLLRMEERHSSLIAQIFWLGYRRRIVSYKRLARQHGKSAWTVRKKINYLADSVFSFTDLPIRLLIRVGGGITILSGLFGLIVVIARLSGKIEVPGYAATILSIVFFGALNLFGLGIVGSYSWRAYENTKARSLYVALRQHKFNCRCAHD
jgi:polyisoprenyl-phosphate glycosyltransferase